MKEDAKLVFEGLKESYSIEEASALINSILLKYSLECKVVFGKKAVEITDSYKVTSMSDRHRICAIITRCGVTQRDYEDLSAEWKFHNAAWNAHFERSHAKDVTLDYDRDPRKSVRIATAVLDALDIE